MPHNTPSPPPAVAAAAGSCRHREEVDAVNEVLRGYGISYPLGARGVRELAAQARHFRKKARRLEEDCARLEETVGGLNERNTQMARDLAREQTKKENL